MKYARLGDTGLVVSRLTLGTMTFGSKYGSIAKVDQNVANDMVARALDAGINFFDTADQYSEGQSEEILGKALGRRRGEVAVATKVGLRMSENLLDAGLSARHVIASAEASLRRLRTDYVDLLQLHVPDPHTPLEETLRALDDLTRRGLVRYVGFCNFPAWQVATALGIQREKGYAPFVSAQMYYSLLGRDIEHEVVPLARHAGLGILPWSPLAGGFLSGKYTREKTGEEGDRRASMDFPPVDAELGYAVVDKLGEIARAHGATVAQTALAWTLSRPFITSVIVGASRVGQLEDNLGAVDLELTSEELRDLDELTAPAPPYPNWMIERFPDAPVEKALRGADAFRAVPRTR